MLHTVLKYEHASIHKLVDSDVEVVVTIVDIVEQLDGTAVCVEVVGSDEGVIPIVGIAEQLDGTAVCVNTEQCHAYIHILIYTVCN